MYYGYTSNNAEERIEYRAEWVNERADALLDDEKTAYDIAYKGICSGMKHYEKLIPQALAQLIALHTVPLEELTASPVLVKLYETAQQAFNTALEIAMEQAEDEFEEEHPDWEE